MITVMLDGNEVERELPKEGEIWNHFKNNLYEIYGVVENTETKEKYICYRALYGTFGKYVRPVSMFMSEVDKEKYPNAEQTFRFEKVFIFK